MKPISRRAALLGALPCGLAVSARAGMVVAPLAPKDSRPGLFNWDPTLLRNAAKAMARVRAGTGDAVIQFIGDSGFTGQGAGTGATLDAGAAAKSIPAVFTKAFAGVTGLPTRRSSFWPNQLANASIASYVAYDPRVSVGDGWARSTTPGGPGQPWLNASDTSAIVFTPGEVWDSCDLYDITYTGNGSLTIAAGGSDVATLDNNAGPGFVRQSFGPGSGISRGAGTLSIRRASGGAVYFLGAECYDSTTPAVRVRGLGASGILSSYWIDTGTPWASLNALSAFAADLTVLRLYRNDQQNGVSAETFRTNMQQIIAALKGAGGDVILWRGQEPNPAAWDLSQDAAYGAALRQLSVSYGCPLIDTLSFLGDYAALQSQGLYAVDGIHFGAIGQTIEANALARALADVVA